jgi:hypothetical protein
MTRYTRWFSSGTPVSSTNKTDNHDITEILLKVALNTITLTIGVYKRIDVKAEGPWGAEDRCSFLVGTKGNNLNLNMIVENI